MSNDARPTVGGRRRFPWLPATHAVLVLGLLVFFAMVYAQSVPGDANIGAGLIGLAIMGLGLPWTIPFFVFSDSMPVTSEAVGLLIRLGPAVVNVAIHALIWFLMNRRRPLKPGRPCG